MDYIKSQLPKLNRQQLWMLLSYAYHEVETSDNEEDILQQLKIAELIEKEVELRKEAIISI